MGFSRSVNGSGSALVGSKSATVAAGATGPLVALRAPLPPPVTWSKVSGHANLSVSGSAIALAAAIATGSSQSIVVRGVSGSSAVEYQVTLTGAGGVTPAPALTFAMFPAGSILLHDPNDATTVKASGGKVSELRPSIGTGKFTQATASAQPVLSAAGGPALKPAYLSGDGVSTTGVFWASDEAALDSWYDGLIARRPNADQNGVATSKTVLSSPRLSDSKISRITLLRTVNDPSQVNVYNSRIGDTSPAALTPFAKGGGWALLSRYFDERDTSLYAKLNAAPTSPTKSAPEGGTTTSAATHMFGNNALAVSDRALVDIALRVRANLALLPGGSEFRYNSILLDALLSWIAFGDGSALLSDNPFKSRAPLQTDLPTWNCNIQTFANSIGLGTASALAGILPAANGQDTFNGCVGGSTSTQILARIVAGQDSGGSAALNSGYTLSRQRSRIVVLGEFMVNDATNGVPLGTPSDTAAGTTFGNVYQAILIIEAAQGVSPGQGRIMLWLLWAGNGNGAPNYAANDAINAQFQALYRKRAFRSTLLPEAVRPSQLTLGETGHRSDVGGSGLSFEVEWQQVVDIGVVRALGKFSEDMA